MACLPCLVAGYQSVSSTCSNIPQQSMLLSKRVSITEVQMDFQAMQMRKRSIDELTNLLPRREPSDLIENKTALSTWKTNKRKKANSPEEPWNHQARESISFQEQKLQVPERQNHSSSKVGLSIWQGRHCLCSTRGFSSHQTPSRANPESVSDADKLTQ